MITKYKTLKKILKSCERENLESQAIEGKSEMNYA